MCSGLQCPVRLWPIQICWCSMMTSHGLLYLHLQSSWLWEGDDLVKRLAVMWDRFVESLLCTMYTGTLTLVPICSLLDYQLLKLVHVLCASIAWWPLCSSWLLFLTSAGLPRACSLSRQPSSGPAGSSCPTGMHISHCAIHVLAEYTHLYVERMVSHLARISLGV